MIAVGDIRQMVGLLEGEGCFGFNHGSPWIQLGMADKDVVQSAAHLWNTAISAYPPQGKGTKPQYRTWVTGADAVGWMMMLYQFMGVRRKGRIRGILADWRSRPLTGAYTYHAGSRTIPACHPERRHYAHGHCRACYDKERMP